MSKDPDSLFQDDPAWTVEAVFCRQSAAQRKSGFAPELSHWELRYDGKVQQKAGDGAGEARLRQLARFCNKRNLTPRPRVECAADAPAPDAYLRRISGL